MPQALAQISCDRVAVDVEAPISTLAPLRKSLIPSPPITVRVNNPSDETCLLSISIEDPLGSQASGVISVDDVTLSFPTPPTGARNLRQSLVSSDLTIPANSTDSLRFTPNFQLRGLPVRGTRLFPLQLVVINQANQTNVIDRPFSLLAEIPPAALISVGGLATNGTLNLGDLSKGGRGALSLHLVSNGQHRVLIESQNGGFLDHTSGRSMGRIPYRLSILNRTSQLTQPIELNRDAATDRAGDVLRLAFSTEPARGEFAGLYKDTVSIEVLTY